MADNYREIPLSQLKLDAKNPRLPRDLSEGERTQERLLQHFARNYNLLELARSMADKGFTPRQAEALLVVGDPENSGAFVVIEGNRRLATLLLLTDESRRRPIGLSQEWDQLAIEAREKGHDFDPVPSVVYDDRKDLAEYLGFRHITGPVQWRPEAKARFIAGLLEDGRSISDVARRIGSNAHTVRRYAEAHAVYEQVLALNFEVEAVEAAFGVFYNALNTPGVRSFLALGSQGEISSLQHNPVPENNTEKLRQLISLLYGDQEKELESVIRESRELKQLGDVLLDREATTVLIETRDLHRAYRVAGGGKNDLMASLRDSFSRLTEANGQAYEFKSDEEVTAMVRRIVQLVDDMRERYELGSE